jgi:hypothetical protein
MAKTWEATGSTDFVITTVNVPDRLDVQEVRARADEDDDRTERFRIDWYRIRVWIVRLFMLALVAGAGVFAWESSLPLRSELSAASIGQRLSGALGEPVRIANAEFRWTPSPRFVVSGIEVGSIWRTDAVTLHFNWEDAWRALRGGGWIWGEASVAPTKLEIAQADFLVRALPKLATGLPASISTIRFESIELRGVRQLPGAFEGVVRRQGDGQFGAITLRQGEDLTLSASLAAGSDGAVGFQFDAMNWRSTVGPAVRWNEAHATGSLREGLVAIPEFLLVGFFGSVKGAVYVAGDVEWVTTGYATGTNLDIEAVLKQAAGAPAGDEGASRLQVPLAGTANADFLIAGRGDTHDAAVGSGVAAGPVRVRHATLNGINLGYAATRPGALSGSGGITRFTELTGWVVAGPTGASFQDLRGRAGAMSTRGEVTLDPDRRLSGNLRVDLGETRVQAPLNVQVRGSLLSPQFGR